MEDKHWDTDYREYARRLAELSKTEPEDSLKQIIKARLAGEGPQLLPGEGDLIDVLILVYNTLRKEGNKKAMGQQF